MEQIATFIQHTSAMSPLVWLITGCSSGFGQQFVHSILARGDQVIATGRRLGALKHLEQAGVAILELDLTSAQADIRDTVKRAIDIHGRIDVLVNNASYIAIGTWEDLEYVTISDALSSTIYLVAINMLIL